MDWEPGQACRNWTAQYSDSETVAKKIREKFHDFFLKQRDLHFYMGMHSQWPHWMIIGVYYPPNDLWPWYLSFQDGSCQAS